MKLVITGAEGFLGWHTRLRLHAFGHHEVQPVNRRNWHELASHVQTADAVIHIAGVNRAHSPEGVESANYSLSRDLSAALESAGRPIDVIYANSIQAGSSTPYGADKQRAGEKLGTTVSSLGGTFHDVRLPNLFGEHGRPHYNSFVATFVNATINGEEPTITDAEVPLLHAQQAAEALIHGLSADGADPTPAAEPRKVRDVWNHLQDFHDTYGGRGDFPDLGDDFRVDLFNTYRAARFPSHYPISLTPHRDNRGMFVETIRSHGGQGQTSISTTAPGITRGEHYHLRKVERFAVVQGHARIELRRMFNDAVITFDVDGEYPVAVDMPTGWAHNLTNTGTEQVLTQFWTHDLFDPSAPDTFFEPVRPESVL